MHVLPLILCVDIEPDTRVPTLNPPTPTAGFEAMLQRMASLREHLSALTSAPVHVTWCLRMDPAIELLYGSERAIADRYADTFDELMALGDELGLHVHAMRLVEGEWVTDHGDAAWVEHCTSRALDAFQRSFDRPCRAYRTGDRFMSDRLASQLASAGIRVDLSLEPGLPSAERLGAGEMTTGLIPATYDIPTHAYRARHDDFRSSAVDRTDGVVHLPLAWGPGDTLKLWLEPDRFGPALEDRLTDRQLTHLAFAIRTDIGLNDQLWDRVESNLIAVSRRLGTRGRWYTASEAAAHLVPLDAWSPPAVPDADRGLGVTTLEWLAGEDDVECLVCGRTAIGDRIVSAPSPLGRGARIVGRRCRTCDSLLLSETHEAAPMNDVAVDRYVELLAGLPPMLQTLATVEPRLNLRVLDIGCGYGFGLDLAAFAWGWTGLGLDPSLMTQRGACELGLDLRTDLLTPTLAVGDPFDVVLASEVVEHVAEPVEFLRLIRERLAPDGVLVLSTPSSAFIHPANPEVEVLAALSPGGHVALYSAQALASMLHEAGFGSVRITEEGLALRAVAATTDAGLAHTRNAPPLDVGLLARYSAWRAENAPLGSALHVGMASRAMRYGLNLGDHGAAHRLRDTLREGLLTRYGIDLDDPEATARRARGETLAEVIADAHYSCGMLALLDGGEPRDAADHFAAAEAVARTPRTGRDPSMPRLADDALAHQALALTRCAPTDAPAVLRRLARSSARAAGPELRTMLGRVFTDLVCAGEYDAASELRDLIEDLMPDPALLPASTSDDLRRSSLDAMFSLAMLCLQQEEHAEAAELFGACADAAGRFHDAHAQKLAIDAAQHKAIARRDGAVGIDVASS